MGTRFLSEREIDLREDIAEHRAMLREMVNNDLADLCREAVRQTLQDLMRMEQAWVLGYLPHERLDEGHRPDYRNGYYPRDVVTSFGLLPRVQVPRCREGTYRTVVLPRYKRRLGQVDQAIRDLFLAGVSTRRVGEITRTLLGDRVSAQTVSSLTQALDASVRAFHTRALADDVVYLFLDGLTMRVKTARGAVTKVLLVAVGISATGHKRVVDFRLVDRETKDHWELFLENLHKRGLRGEKLECITTDGNPGLISAVQMVYAAARRQRCWVHKMRNVTNKLRKDERKEALVGMAQIYCAENRRQAIAAFRRWHEKWHPIDPEAADCLKRDLEELLTIFSLPVAHRVLVRTTNPPAGGSESTWRFVAALVRYWPSRTTPVARGYAYQCSDTYRPPGTESPSALLHKRLDITQRLERLEAPILPMYNPTAIGRSLSCAYSRRRSGHR